MVLFSSRCFFFQAEDGIRGRNVTGVQTCALPIWVDVPPDMRIVTYVSRGFESMRGFDIFMRSAKLIYERYPNVIFFVVGTDRIAYGGDENYIPGYKSFKDWTLSRDKYDMGKFIFTGRLTPAELGRLLATSDL